jgi:hypothetical protein
MWLALYLFQFIGRYSRESGNPGLLLFKENGFPITTSGMTNKKSCQDAG